MPCSPVAGRSPSSSRAPTRWCGDEAHARDAIIAFVLAGIVAGYLGDSRSSRPAAMQHAAALAADHAHRRRASSWSPLALADPPGGKGKATSTSTRSTRSASWCSRRRAAWAAPRRRLRPRLTAVPAHPQRRAGRRDGLAGARHGSRRRPAARRRSHRRALCTLPPDDDETREGRARECLIRDDAG